MSTLREIHTNAALYASPVNRPRVGYQLPPGQPPGTRSHHETSRCGICRWNDSAERFSGRSTHQTLQVDWVLSRVSFPQQLPAARGPGRVERGIHRAPEAKAPTSYDFPPNWRAGTCAIMRASLWWMTEPQTKIGEILHGADEEDGRRDCNAHPARVHTPEHFTITGLHRIRLLHMFRPTESAPAVAFDGTALKSALVVIAKHGVQNQGRPVRMGLLPGPVQLRRAGRLETAPAGRQPRRAEPCRLGHRGGSVCSSRVRKQRFRRATPQSGQGDRAARPRGEEGQAWR